MLLTYLSFPYETQMSKLLGKDLKGLHTHWTTEHNLIWGRLKKMKIGKKLRKERQRGKRRWGKDGRKEGGIKGSWERRRKYEDKGRKKIKKKKQVRIKIEEKEKKKKQEEAEEKGETETEKITQKDEEENEPEKKEKKMKKQKINQSHQRHITRKKGKDSTKQRT